VTFPGHDALNEAHHAQLVSRHFGTEHHELSLDEAGADLLPTLVRHYDEPMADSSLVPTYMLSRVIRQHAKVAIGGDGGDELFGGYRHYRWLEWHAMARRWAPAGFRSLAARVAERHLPIGVPRRNHVIGLAGSIGWAVAHVNIYFDAFSRHRLLSPAARAQLSDVYAPEIFRASLCDPADSVLQQATLADFETYLPDDLLVKVDRASMATSLELRAPWLDHHIIEFAFGDVPDELRAAGGARKILLRRLAARVLPPEFDTSRKQGFTPPLAHWLEGEWRRFIREVLSGMPRTLFDPVMVTQLLDGQARGRPNEQRLFALVMFELWRREFGIEVPS
jgi:asparagine synthase (glutamine-hydrolysing)